MRNAFFSVIIPSRNRGGLLLRAVNSVLQQTFEEFEIIVIDDASNDNSKSLINGIGDERIQYYVNETNLERCVSRNIGIDKAQGRFICFLDSDDSFLPDHLQTLYDGISLNSNKEALYFTNSYNLNADGSIEERLCPDINNSSNVLDYILRYTFNPSRVAVEAGIMKYFKFDPEIPGLEDFDIWLRIALKHPILQIKKRTVMYNLHSESYTIGDAMRYEKELKYFRYIFNKPELASRLNKSLCNRLLSMCYYHLSVKSYQLNHRVETLANSIRSFILYPKGYNGNTNKTLLVLSLYSLPILGDLIKLVNKFIK